MCNAWAKAWSPAAAGGIAAITLDGTAFDGPLVPLDPAVATTRELRLTLGAPAAASRQPRRATGSDR